ncbi:MAG: hypothetical protein A3J83_03410 [Elusimicrobia bacterium RIFOXYA2_FULL_40_6]|nr:MAG: hypothetical protein A3J83_03410 [Elusimicrobia bacterium RIFOXYA2_FULL_40_6]
MSLKAVIFDMDGVIIDSEPVHYLVNKEMFGQFGIKFTQKDNDRFIGVSNPAMYAEYKSKYEINLSIEELSRLQLEKFLKKINNSFGKYRPIPGITALLAELKENNIKIGLASASDMEVIEAVLKSFRIKDYFKVIVSGIGMKRGKPAPDIFLKTAKKLRVKPADCAVIEDSKHGVQAAISAGMKCIGYKNANSGNQDISKADLVVNKISKIDVGILKKLWRVR